MKPGYSTCYLLILFFHWALFAMGQAPVYQLHQYNADNGLPQNSVKGIAKDRHGFIWLLTENGLVRFAGNSFFIFDNSYIPVSLQRYSSFQPDLVYKRSETSALEDAAFYAMTGKFEYVRIENGTAHLDSSNRILQNLAYIPDDLNSTYLTLGLPNRFRRTLKPERYLIPSVGGGMYVSREDRVEFFYGKKKQYEVPFRSMGFWTFFRIGEKLFSDNENGTFSNISAKGVTLVKLTGDVLSNPSYQKGKRYEIFFNNASGDAFIYIDESFYRLKQGRNGNLNSTLILSGFNFDDNNIVSAYYDEAEGAVFLGSLTKGLFLFRKKFFTVLKTNIEGKDNVFYAQTPYGENSVLTPQGDVLGAGVVPRIVSRLIRKTADWDRYSILTDLAGNIWMKRGDFLYRFNRTGDRILNQWNLNSEISQLSRGASGEIWIGTRKRGLFRIDPDNESAMPLPFYEDNLLEISFIQHETDNKLWVGTDRGLYCLDVKTRKISKEIKELKGTYVRSLYIPNRDEVWITTSGRGFYLWKGEKLIAFPKDEGGYLNDVHCIVEDSKGYFWLPTNKGLFQVSKNDLLLYSQKKTSDVFFLYFDKSDGFNTNEFNGGCTPCAVKFPNGNVSLPSMDGLVWFNPKDVEAELPDKRIFVDNATVDGIPVTIKDTLVLPRNFEQLQFHLTTPYFGNARNLHFYYALRREGAEDTPWMKINDQVFISNLKHGSYQLLLRKTNGFGQNNFTNKVVTLIVAPAYYETSWFMALLLVVGGVVIYGLIKIRTQFLITKNQRLELRVAERTTELEYTLKALKTTEDNLSWQAYIQEQIIAAISHDIRTPLKYLTYANQQIHEFIVNQQHIDESVVEISKSAYDSAFQMHSQTTNLLQYIKLQLDRVSGTSFEAVNLSSIVHEKVKVFSDIAAVNTTRIVNEVQDGEMVYSIKELLAIVVHNLLDNSVKLTTNGEIKISFKREVSGCLLILEDSAMGMPEELVQWLTSQEVDQAVSKSKKRPPKQSGVGLIIVKELVKLLRLTLTVEVVKEVGTKIYLAFDETKKQDTSSELTS